MDRPALLLLSFSLFACDGRALPGAADAGAQRSSDAAVPGLPLDPPPPGGSSWTPPMWQCETRVDGRHFCRKMWPDDGLPPGGASWLCHLALLPQLPPVKGPSGERTWFCDGAATHDPGGPEWSCRQVGPGSWRCHKPDTVGGDRPPATGPWVCLKGNVYGGSLCEKVADSDPPGVTGNGPCLPGQRLWCDGLVYGGWGQAACDPATGQWKTVTKNGTKMIDCHADLAGGKLPLTACVRYHFFFNPACCERSDCVVPDGTAGQTCAPSPGQLCDPCNPLKPECTAPGASCVVTNAHETFCAKDCSDDTPCPAGYQCMEVKTNNGTTKQCVPTDFSCYY